MKNEKIIGNLMAGFTIVIWGITFVSTKLLLKSFTPEEIVLFRFVIAFFVLLVICPQKIRVENIKEELIFASLGLTGITLYFWIENLALKWTYASNVGLISSAIPIFTALLAHFITKDEKFSMKFIFGFIIAFTGIFMIIYNGRILKLNPVGDILALLTALLFSVYSVILKFVNSKYSQIFITKKIFFYGVIFTMPLILTGEVSLPAIEKLNTGNIANLLFLALFASVICFIMWNKAVKIIGSVKAANYIYFVPIITMSGSALFLNEKISMTMIIGGSLIFIGVYLNNREFSANRDKIQKN